MTDAGRVVLHAADGKKLSGLHLDVGSDVIVDSTESVDDSVRTVVTGLVGTDVTVRDAVPRYAAGARIRLWRGRPRTRTPSGTCGTTGRPRWKPGRAT